MCQLCTLLQLGRKKQEKQTELGGISKKLEKKPLYQLYIFLR
jgi:hypothetical protein